MKDYYQILGVDKTATAEEIKTAYRRLARQYHPDKNPAEDAKAKFQEINEAYQILSDENRRRRYNMGGDKSRHYQESNDDYYYYGADEQWEATSASAREAFAEWLRQQQQQRTQVYHISVPLEKAYTGFVYKDGEHVINLPQGVADGSTVNVDGRLYTVHINPGSMGKFGVRVHHLFTNVTINAFDAMLGVDATLTHIDGAKLNFRIPAGTQNGTTIKLAGKGLYSKMFNSRGDVYIRIDVEIPRSLTENLRAAIMREHQQHKVDI